MSKPGTSASKPDPLSASPVRQRNTLRVVLSNPNAIQKELDLLDLESSYVSTRKLPLLSVDAAKTKCNQLKPPLDQQAASSSSDPFIHLIPSSSTNKKPSETNLQHYLYIPNRSLPPATSQSITHKGSNVLDTKVEIAQEAKREAAVIQQVNKLTRLGLWSANRLPKVMEPKRGLSHWDCLLDEARWMAIDFKEERKWKIAAARKVGFVLQYRPYIYICTYVNILPTFSLQLMRRLFAF